MVQSEFKAQEIVAQLARFRQRATYGALAGLVGGLARSVMTGQPKIPLNSWIVAADTGLPTGYAAAETDSELLVRQHVISSADELRDWLRSPS